MKSVWPSGECKPILMLKFGIDKCERLFNIKIRSGADDLDEYKEGLLNDEEIGNILFFEYKSPPIPGVSIHIDKSINSTIAIASIKSHLGITSDDINWQLVDIKNLVNDCDLEIERILLEKVPMDSFLKNVREKLSDCKMLGYTPTGKNLEAMQLLGSCVEKYYSLSGGNCFAKKLIEITKEISDKLNH